MSDRVGVIKRIPNELDFTLDLFHKKYKLEHPEMGTELTRSFTDRVFALIVKPIIIDNMASGEITITPKKGKSKDILQLKWHTNF